MLAVLDQLRDLARTLSLVSDVVGKVEPGQPVNVDIVSTAQQLLAANPLSLGALTPAPAAQLLSQMSVRVKAEWKVVKVVDTVETELKLGEDYLMPATARGENAGSTGAQASFLFKPPIEEMLPRDGLPPVMAIRIEPTITLEALILDGPIPQHLTFTIPNQDTQRVDPGLLKLNLDLLPLEIPALLVLFRHNRFRPFENDMTPGFALAVFRGGGCFREVTQLINDVLRRIEDVVRPLKALAGFAAFLAKLPLLRSALGAQPMVRTIAGNEKDLDDIHMRTDTFLGFDILDRDLRAEDRTSSLMFLGPPNLTVGCYSRRDFKEDGGFFKVTTGLSMIVLVEELKSLDLSSSVEGVTVVVEDDDDDTFENSISSVKFDP